MQKKPEGKGSAPIVIEESTEELHVPGFSERYCAYIEAHPDLGALRVLCGMLILGSGALIAIAGGLALMFGPSVVSYSMLRGPTLWQSIQVVPGPVTLFGVVVMAFAKWLLSPRAMSPTTYLLTHYSLATPGNRTVGKIRFDYQGEDVFRIAL